MYEIAVIVPVMRRPCNVAPLVESLTASTDRARLVFVADIDDTAELHALKKHDVDVVLNVDRNRRSFAIKTNIAYRCTDEPWMLLCGDDVRFHPGWVEASIDLYPDHGMISTNDMGNRRVMHGLHATHPIVRRDWVDQHGASWDGPGTLCHEGYHHWYVDDEWTAVAQAADQFVFAEDAKIEHRHHLFGKGENDATYRFGQQRVDHDRMLYHRRRRHYAS